MRISSAFRFPVTSYTYGFSRRTARRAPWSASRWSEPYQAHEHRLKRIGVYSRGLVQGRAHPSKSRNARGRINSGRYIATYLGPELVRKKTSPIDPDLALLNRPASVVLRTVRHSCARNQSRPWARRVDSVRPGRPADCRRHATRPANQAGAGHLDPVIPRRYCTVGGALCLNGTQQSDNFTNQQ